MLGLDILLTHMNLLRVKNLALHSARSDRTARACEISGFCLHDASGTPAGYLAIQGRRLGGVFSGREMAPNVSI